MGTMENLAGKRILLIGCGTIGSFLAQQLTQCGCGRAGGRLDLVDDDVLRPANLGRHLLGVPYLNRNKAEGCASNLVINEGCGDAQYASFPVTRSVAAAAMACDLVLDWANGSPGNRFRSLTFDPNAAFPIRSRRERVQLE
jgi:tRNA A37 threonylcarbamoyladenosine dehydratase